jgi:hypothetical protein
MIKYFCQLRNVMFAGQRGGIKYLISLYPFSGYEIGKMFKGSVVGFFRVLWKEASRQLPFRQMIGDAIAAGAFPAAWFVGTVASCQIVFLFAFHELPSVKHLFPDPSVHHLPVISSALNTFA